MKKPEHDTPLPTSWYEKNYIKLNDDKYHLLVAEYNYGNLWAEIGEARIRKSAIKKLLGLILDRNLIFDYCELTQKVNHRIVYIHEKCLGKVYNDDISSFEELLKKNN